MRIRILEGAKQDLLDSYRFYESQDVGLGQYFLDGLSSDIESLQLYAGIHPRHFGYHRLLSKRFPFAVYYRVERDVVALHAILDCRQAPGRTKERLEPE